MHTVKVISNNGLCIGCGICKAICPKNAIKKKLKNGLYFPEISFEQCISCGICYNLCPGRGFDYTEYYKKNRVTLPHDLYTGNYIEVFNGKTRDMNILKSSVSGGIVTTLVKVLLKKKEYDKAFLVDSYKYEKEVVSRAFGENDNLDSTPKSRYVPVSHEYTVKYMIENRQSKIIIVATSCCVHGILNVISKFNLDRENYLIVGLFCDKTMNNGVYKHFQEHCECKKELGNLYFRTKDAGGWPGNVRLEYLDGTFTDLCKYERMKIKEYYMPEKCLYCLDKLNQFSDISVGDNYTEDTDESTGSSTVIVRTSVGEIAVNLIREHIEYNETSIERIIISQHIEARKLNSGYIQLKNHEALIQSFEKIDINKKLKKDYKMYLEKIEIGQEASYAKVIYDINKNNRMYKRIIRKIVTISHMVTSGRCN